MPTFVEALKAEITELEDQLARDPRYRQLQQLKRVLPLYENAPSTPPARAASPSRVRSSGAPSASADAKNAVRQVLARTAWPVATRDIVKALAARGVEIGGRVPQNTLSALLSKSDAFVSHGRSGWTLAVPDGHDTEKAGDERFAEAASPTLLDRRPDQPVPPAQGREAVPGGGT